MKVRIHFLLLSFALLLSMKSNSQTIEGLSYADATPISIMLHNDKIGKISSFKMDADEKDADHLQTYIAPGLIDVQINGYVGVDFSGPDLSVEGVRKATRALWKAGVTSYFPTIITSDVERMKTNFEILAQARKDAEIGRSIPGFHLEGPYISPLPGFRGAHLAKYIKNPDWVEFLEIQKAAEGGIRLVTLAPELKGAIPFIRKLVESGLTVSLGHHNGSAEDVARAVAAGARMSTHLGNGCANEIDRHDNPLWPQLSNDSLTISIIGDGFHLTREEVRTFYKAKGVDKTILVSDALDLAGLPSGEYIRGERTLLLTPDVVKLPKENVLAGAASPISQCVGRVMEFTGCSLSEAIRMASTNPARLFSLKERDTLAVGKRADIILFTMENNEMTVQQTYIAGESVYMRE